LSRTVLFLATAEESDASLKPVPNLLLVVLNFAPHTEAVADAPFQVVINQLSPQPAFASNMVVARSALTLIVKR
jgi:hypothetical protein